MYTTLRELLTCPVAVETLRQRIGGDPADLRDALGELAQKLEEGAPGAGLSLTADLPEPVR